MELTAFMLAQSGIWSQWLWPLIELVVGLGLVIFVHELGHFLMAKAVNIRVDKFALGFGPRVWGFKRGETDYCLNALPLGGYVKMLGQEDFKPLDEGQADPRAFNNKPVWARLVVVSAGVVMNVIFAGILFVVVGLIGVQFPAAAVGSVLPGYPAAKAQIAWDSPIPAAAATRPAMPAGSVAAASTASVTAQQATVTISTGLMPDDRILSVDGMSVERWQSVAMRSVLARADQQFTFRIVRKIDGRTVEGTARLGVRKNPDDDDRLTFGMVNSPDLTLEVNEDARAVSPFRGGDRIIAVDGRGVDTFGQFENVVEGLNHSPVTVTVERLDAGKTSRVDISLPLQIALGKTYLLSEDRKSTTPIDATIVEKSPIEVKVRYPDGRIEIFDAGRVVGMKLPKDNVLTILGMSPRVAVAAVMNGSPADRAGFQPGDIIADYGDLGHAPSYLDLQDLNARYVDKGADITLLRDGKMLPVQRITPRKSGERALLGFTNGTDFSHLVVAGVEQSSPAAAAKVDEQGAEGGIKPGDVIEAINGQPVSTWQDVFFRLQTLIGQDVTFTVRRNTRVLQASIGKLEPQMFDPLAFGRGLLPPDVATRMVNVTIHKPNPIAAIVWGTNETWDFTLSTYVSLHRLLVGTVSPSEVRGPLGIGSAAIVMGRTGLAHMIYFMAIISISLAVINFLPIPVVDGGHVVFLAIEKIRGKPVPVKVMNVAQIIGMALLLALFALAMKNDIFRIINHKW